MPYLPRTYMHDTHLPKAFGRDLKTQIDLLEEEARSFFPQIQYFSLRNVIGIATTDNVTATPAPVGVPGGSAFDPLWGEMVDPGMVADEEWSQPHLNPDLAADTQATEVYDGPFTLHGRVQREAKERELKRYGFDEIRDILVHIPSSLLDAQGITVFPGDKFIWDGDEYLVKQDSGSGWWKNSNVRLWRTLNAEHKKRGA